jgi:hypothetical protein
MADQGIQGLFGGMGTPEQMQQQMIQQKAAQFAQMTPDQQLGFMGYQGGANLGRGLAGAFGVDVQDPTIKKATMLRQLASQYDTNTVEGLRQMAQAVQGSDPELGYQISQRAQAMELAQAKVKTEEATAAAKLEEKKTPEQKNAYDIVSNDPLVIAGSPEFKKNYVETLKGLTSKAITPHVDKVGVAESTREPVYFDKATNEQFTVKDGKRVPFSGGIDQTTAKVSATASSKGADEGAKTSAELDAKRVNAAQVASDKAIEQADVLQQLLKTPQPISGTGAPARVAALRVFSTVGLTSSKDNEALSNADKFNSLAGERVLTFIKTLGTNPTDSDREFARTIGPALEKGTKTNQDLANYLLKRARETTQAAGAMEEHYYNNNYSLRGYKSPFLSKLETPTSTAGMSAEDLAKAAGGKIVNGKFVKD